MEIPVAMRPCIFLLPIYESLFMVEPLIKFSSKVALYGGSLFLRTLIENCQPCIFHAIVGLSSLNPTLIPLVQNLGDISL
jgi:hypothetical protein